MSPAHDEYEHRLSGMGGSDDVTRMGLSGDGTAAGGLTSVDQVVETKWMDLMLELEWVDQRPEPAAQMVTQK